MAKHLLKLSKINKQIFRYLVVATVLAVPLYPKFPFLALGGIQVSLRLEDILLFFLYVSWFFVAWPTRKTFFKDRMTLSIFSFWFVGLVSLISGIFLTETVSPFVGMLHWARRVEYMMAFFIGIYAISQKGDLRFYIKCIFVTLLFAFLYGAGQKYLHWPIITTQNSEYAKGLALYYMPGSHLVSTFAGHYDLASYLILFMPFLSVLLFSKEKIFRLLKLRGNVWLLRGFVLMIFSFSLWLLVNSASRISLVSYLGSAMVALVLNKRAKFIPVLLVFSFVFLFFSSNLIARYMNIIKVTLERIVYTSNTSVYAATTENEIPQRREDTIAPTSTPEPVFEDRSTSIRLNAEWPRAIRALSKNPLLGTGYSSITLATDNDYLRMLGEVGLMGFFSFFLILGWLYRSFLWSMFSGKLSGLDYVLVSSLVASSLGIFLNMVFIDILEASKFAIVFWLCLGFAYSIVLKRNK